MPKPRRITLAVLVMASWGCGSQYDPPPAFASTRADPGHAPTLEGVTHVELHSIGASPVVMFAPWTIRDRDSVEAVVAFLRRRDSAWQPAGPDLGGAPYPIYSVDFYRGPALAATLISHGTNFELRGEFGAFEQPLSLEEVADLNALLRVGLEVVPVPPREAAR